MSIERLRFTLGLSLACLATACGPDASADPSDGESSSASSVDDSASSEASSAEGNNGSDVSSDEGDAGEVGETGAGADIPARGINIRSVVANPGTRIPLAQGDAWVDGNNRNGFLPRDRDTLIRINYDLDENWTPRLIEARLHLEYADGETETLVQVLEVTRPSEDRFLDRSFFFGLVAEDGQAKPGMRFQVELFEVGPGAESLPEMTTVSPATGREIIGFEDTPMEMKVVFVPVNYQGTLPGLTDEDKEFIVENGLLQQNPLQSVEVEWHEPINYDTTINDLGQLLPVMSQLRQSEGRIASNWYYAALVRTGGGGVSGVAGIAYLVGSNLQADRVSANVWFRQESSTNTIVHEVGHNQGLQHVFCAGGNAANTNPSYPDPGGFLLQPGFGIRDFSIRPESQFDYMSYCGPSWVSEWTWNVTYQRIKALTAYDYDDGGAQILPPTQALLKGLVHRDGSVTWWTGDGSYDPELTSGNHTVEFDLAGSTQRVAAEVSRLSDDESFWIEVPLPSEDFAAIEAIRYGSPEKLSAVDRASVKVGYSRR